MNSHIGASFCKAGQFFSLFSKEAETELLVSQILSLFPPKHTHTHKTVECNNTAEETMRSEKGNSVKEH